MQIKRSAKIAINLDEKKTLTLYIVFSRNKFTFSIWLEQTEQMILLINANYAVTKYSSRTRIILTFVKFRKKKTVHYLYYIYLL